MDLIKVWLKNVSYSHSGSERTEISYRYALQKFLDFIGKSPDEILDDYKKSTDREFREEYTPKVRAYITEMMDYYAVGSIRTLVCAIKSFFKYNDFPLGHIPMAKNRTTYHNRDITKEEINEIFAIARPRERAFFCMMAKSGLRPHTLCKLRYKHVLPDFKRTIPCKIIVPESIAKGKYHGYFSFMDKEAVGHLEDYLKTRKSVQPSDFLFTRHRSNKPVSPTSISTIFGSLIEKLRESGVIDFEQKQKRKPRTIRLYSLRKWFRKQAGQAGTDYVHFWMGHKLEHQDTHYFSRDVELHRKQYKQKAMPSLRLETATPTETEKKIMELKDQLASRDTELNALKETVAKMRPLIEWVDSFENPENLQRFLNIIKTDFAIHSLEGKGALARTTIPKYISDEVDKIAKIKGITSEEALNQVVKRGIETLKKTKKNGNV